MASLIEEEFEDLNQSRGWKVFFDRIQNEASVTHQYTVKQARLPENRDRNRYRDVSPCDDYRVELDSCENNYINASYVQVPLAKRTYILTQGPLAHTSGHFWLMVWQQNSRGILMLNKVIEDGRLKCHPYFPMGSEFGGEDSLTYPDVNMRVEYIECEDCDYYVKRTLRLCNLQTDEEKIVLQFHYIDWPDFGIPKNPQSFLAFLYAVRQSGVIPTSEDTKQHGPPVIHCSAGIGRSGTFCLVDSALVLVERTRSLSSLDLRSMLIDMRQYRCGLIQRPEQLQFSYMAILDGAHDILSSPPSAEPGSVDEVDSDLSEVSSAGNETDDEMDSGPDPVNTINEPRISQPADGPQPPVRTSSLASDQDKPEQAPPAPDLLANKPLDVPEPPRRTSSLHKAASMDECPPPVPPRPPTDVKRQVSAPAIPEASSTSGKEEDEDEEDEGYENTSDSQMKRRREEMREAKKRKTKELVESMRAKQIAAEESGGDSYSRYVLGAAVVLALAVSAMFIRNYI